jgi:hypothetical protein
MRKVRLAPATMLRNRLIEYTAFKNPFMECS